MVRSVALVVLTACGRIGFGEVDRAAVVDAASDATPDTSGACGPPVLADDFEDGAFAPLWTVRNEPQVIVTESAGVVTIALAANAGEAYGDVQSACRYDMRDRELSIEIVDTVAGAQAEMFVQLQIDGANRLGFDLFQNGRLQAYHRIGGVYTAVDEVTFDAAAHRFWRLGESGGMMTWETSSDRAIWSLRGTTVTPIDLSSVILGMHAGTFGNVAAPGSAVFDNVDAR